jgi:LuxR family maltose regulon positive regulatory protein
VPATPDLAELRRSVDAALAAGDSAAAVAALRPAALAVALEDGTGFRDLLTSLPESLWHDDVVLASALGSSYRSVGSPSGSAPLAYFRAAQNAVDAAAAPVPASERVALLTAHAAALRTLGLVEQASAMLADAGALLASEISGADYVPASARFALEMGVVDLVLGRLDSARQRLEYAHGLAADHLTPSERIECLGVLALAAYSQGDLAATDRHIAEAAAVAAPDAVMRSGFASALYAADILVTTDRQDRERVSGLVDAMAASSANTEWEPFAGVVSAYARALSGKPIEALDLLHHAHQRYMRWQPPGIGLDIGDLLRADILGQLDRGEEAYAILAKLNPHERHALCPERFMARLALQHGDLHGADIALADCELLGEAHSPRTLMDVQLLRGAIEMERGDLSLSDVSIDRALHAMARTGVRSPFRHIPPNLLGKIAERALRRPQSDEIRRMLTLVAEATAGHDDDEREALSERERLVLVYVERQLTVAQIAAELFISPNTVKTHLRRLYRKLGVATRDEAIRKARTLGLHLETGIEITRGSPAVRGTAGRDPVL